MPITIDFDHYQYYPSLRTRLAELRGYEMLPDTDKAALLPIFVLGKYQQRDSSTGVAEILVEKTANFPFLLDLSSDRLASCEDAVALSNPANGFRAWRTFVGGIDNAVPVALMPPNAPIREVIQQVLTFEQSHGSVAVRSRQPLANIPVLRQVAESVRDPDNLLVILDFGLLQDVSAQTVAATVNLINELRRSIETLRIVTMATTFPRAVDAHGEHSGQIPIREIDFHSTVGPDVTIYGDHGSIHAQVYDPQTSRFIPRVDYPLDSAWIYRRYRINDVDERTRIGGYQRAAQEIVGHTSWDQNLVGAIWGADRIADAAAGNLDGMGAPTPWIAVRVNLHLHRQIERTNNMGVE